MVLEQLESRSLFSSIPATTSIGALVISHTGTLMVAGLPTAQRLEVVTKLNNDAAGYVVNSANAAIGTSTSPSLIQANTIEVLSLISADETKQSTLRLSRGTSITKVRNALAALGSSNQWFSIRSMNSEEMFLVDRGLFKRVQIDLGGGADFINVVGNLSTSVSASPMTVLGGNGDDTMQTYSDHTLMSGGSGDDYITGTQSTGGTLLGGSGDDYLVSNIAGSIVDGGSGNDTQMADDAPNMKIISIENSN